MSRVGLVLAALSVAASILTAHASAQTFRRPTACADCIGGWYYFDETGVGGGLRDWSCGSSTYDGHSGTDFVLAGGNAAIDEGHDVVAAADGIVVSAVDGHHDRCTTCSAAVDPRCGTDHGLGYGNHVVIDHGETRAIYGHLRSSSVRVAPGDTVRCGDTIGEIGSSGCSTGAHLHFETRPAGEDDPEGAFDPFAGPCSATVSPRWADQGAHRGLPSPLCDPGVALDAAIATDAAADATMGGSCGCRVVGDGQRGVSPLVLTVVLLALRTRRREGARA